MKSRLRVAVAAWGGVVVDPTAAEVAEAFAAVSAADGQAVRAAAIRKR
jgi:hypothetical protein